MLRYLTLLVAFGTHAGATPEVDSNNLARLHALMQPTAEETRWLQIPWRTSLWQARKRPWPIIRITGIGLSKTII